MDTTPSVNINNSEEVIFPTVPPTSTIPNEPTEKMSDKIITTTVSDLADDVDDVSDVGARACQR